MPERLHRLLIGLLAASAIFAVLEFATDRSDSDQKQPQGEQVVLEVPTGTRDIQTATATPPVIQSNARVLRVVDGDTIVASLDAEAGEFTIRLLGINTPETVDPRRPVECFGKEASQRMHGFADGKRVRLEPDPQADERDKYGRLLRNLFLEDGTDVNAEMVKGGYAYAYLSFPLNPVRKRALNKWQEDAKMAGLGLWATSTCSGLK